MNGRYWLETLGCPKNQVDSDKLVGTLVADGMSAATGPEFADLVVVNTCAFIDAARAESIETVLALAQRRRPGARLVVTGCMAERYGAELADALPEVDLVAGFGQSLTADCIAVQPADLIRDQVERASPVPARLLSSIPGQGVRVDISPKPGRRVVVPDFDLLNLPRPPSSAPWAYVKVAEGCDRKCGFCAIPTFRGRQRSRTMEAILDEVDALGAAEVVLVAQDLASYGRDGGDLADGRDAGYGGGGQDQGDGGPVSFGPDEVGRSQRRTRRIVELVQAVSEKVEWVRLLYLYPSELDDELIAAVCGTGVPYFDLSLQHVSRSLLRGMRRWGSGERFAQRIGDIRRSEPEAVFRSSFIVGYPGETEEDHDALLEFLTDTRLDWAGFFSYSPEEGTHAAGLDGAVPAGLVAERMRELSELQDQITAAKRTELIGSRLRVLVDGPELGRSYREAPEIDGVVHLPANMVLGDFVDVVVTGAEGPDLYAVPQARLMGVNGADAAFVGVAASGKGEFP
ncbi:MAG: 30S ribosomal protein S12 methylthiotransferase RimO [Acidimicrobiales bacterium]